MARTADHLDGTTAVDNLKSSGISDLRERVEIFYATQKGLALTHSYAHALAA